ncbi:MAG TPA: DUF2203 domain-containing protein [Polyangiaceae bacterium]|jgi:hypothetical protein|nr:DUF2203 domain-containing protein [Polyangiaceae bacterium]
MTQTRGAETATRVFSIAEVNALIPSLSGLVERQLREQSEIEQGLAELTRLTGKPPRSLAKSPDDGSDVGRLKSDLRGRVHRYEAGWAEVQNLGGVVKDPRIGLVDFYGRIEGRTVWLCWRYGEESIGYYHDLDAGFSGRRALSPQVRRALVN